MSPERHASGVGEAAMEDRAGFCKVLAERGTGRILGAHIMGPQAPALTEVIDNTLRSLAV